MGKIRTSEFGSEVGIWLKCLLAKVLRKCLATMTYDQSINQSNQMYFPAIIMHVTQVYLHDVLLIVYKV